MKSTLEELKVLHITEAFGGGVTSAIQAFAAATPLVEHHLLATPRPLHDTGPTSFDEFESVSELDEGLRGTLRGIRRAVSNIAPHLIHVHSSKAGFYGRLSKRPGVPIVYSPHCFAFDRLDVNNLSRLAFRYIERGLAHRTSALAAVSPYEMQQAQSLSITNVCYVPNRAGMSGYVASHTPDNSIVFAGRICAQKDWRFAIDLKRSLQDMFPDLRWIWLGGGGRNCDESQVRDAGIEVTGWLPRSAILDRMSRATLYVHTAAWEGAPITLLEACDMGLPTAVRAIPSLISLKAPGTFITAQEMLSILAEVRTPEGRRRRSEMSLRFAEGHTKDKQGKALMKTYLSAQRAL